MNRKERRKKNKKIKLLTILEIILIIIIVITSVYIFFWIKDNNKNKNLLKTIEETITIDESNNEINYNIDFKKLREINPHTVGWIKVDGTNINYSVVQAQDNEYYLNHTFDNSYNSAGWIFMDCANKLDGTDKNIVIYGHNRKDGSMFGSLNNILNEDWINKNKEVLFFTEQETSKYEIFSVYEIKNEDYYIKTQFRDEEFSEFIKTIKDRSIYNLNVDVKETDSILTLSTCGSNSKYRLVLHAKRII